MGALQDYIARPEETLEHDGHTFVFRHATWKDLQPIFKVRDTGTGVADNMNLIVVAMRGTLVSMDGDSVADASDDDLGTLALRTGMAGPVVTKAFEMAGVSIPEKEVDAAVPLPK